MFIYINYTRPTKNESAMFTLLLILLVSYTHAECVYDDGYSFDMVRFTDPLTHRTERAPLGLSVMSDDTLLNTIDKCANLCHSLPWCVAVSDHPRQEEHLCQFHTDRVMLGLLGHFKCDLNNFKCRVTDSSLLNFNDQVFEVVNVDAYGFKVHERVVPSRIIPFEEGTAKFCKVLKSDSQVSSDAKNTKIYSEYYGTEAGIPDMWVDALGHSANGGANFYRPGTSSAVGGYPITAIRRDDVIPAKNLRAQDHYNFYRHEYLKQTECSMPLGHEFIDPEALKGDTYFFIKYANGFYLKCSVEGSNDDVRKCEWTETPEMMWTVAEFDLSFRGTLQVNEYGYNKVLIGHSVTTGEEVGWIDRSHCHSDTDEGDSTRLLVGGKKNGQGLHCGASNWGFVRMEDLKLSPILSSAKIGGGTSICHNQDKNREFDDELVTSCISADQSHRRVSKACSMVVQFEFKANHMCTGGRGAAGANTIQIEVADVKTDGKLYEVYKDHTKSHRLTCSQFGDRLCRWIPVSSAATKQIIKFNNNFISNSVTNKITDHNKFTNARQTAAIYELIGSFWTFVGNIELRDETKLGLTNAVSGSSVVGWVKSGNKIMRTQYNKGVVGVGDGDTVHVAKDHVLDLTFVEKTGFNNDTEIYKWVTDGTDTCPTGYYLHQSRCFHDQLCNKPQHGCVKVNEETCQLNNTKTSTVSLKHDQFMFCPDGQIVYGRNATHMHCKHVTITPPVTPASDFPTPASLGFLSNIDNNATKTVINAANWKGTPIQGFNPHKEGILEWHYGRKCYVDFPNSRSVNKGEDFPSANVPDKAIVCDEPNEFITQLRCLTDDCRSGLEVRCETTKNCRLDGEPHVVQPQGTELPVCPFGMVLTAITCKALEKSGGVIIPCEKVHIKCQRVIFDPDYHPTKPPTPGESDKSSLKIILISLGVGLPLIVISAIVCLFCIPDNAAQTVNERAGARVVDTKETVVNSDYDGLRRRKKRVLKY